MEYKRVKCINTKGTLGRITKGEIYSVKEEGDDSYLITNDTGRTETWYIKELFEEVKEDILMVECIDNSNGDLSITLNKQYKILEESSLSYYIMNDANEIADYLKSHFKPVPKEKEIKEYGLTETLFLKDGEKYKSEHKTIRREGELIIIESLVNENKIVLSLKDKFTKVEEPKPVSTVEAFKALEEGKIIESVITRTQYKKINKSIYSKSTNGEFRECRFIDCGELENQWLIIE